MVIRIAVVDFMNRRVLRLAFVNFMNRRVLRLAFAFLLAISGFYSFLYGLSAIVNIYDIYEEYTLSALWLQIDFFPFSLSMNLISAGLIAFSLVIGSFYLIMPNWEELKKIWNI